MPTPTYDLIASNVLSSSASSVTFSSIPATYRDLILVAEVSKSSSGFVSTWVQFNSDTGNNYFTIPIEGNSSTRASVNSSSDQKLIIGINYGPVTNTSKLLCVMQFLDYSATNKHKTALFRANNSAEMVGAYGGRWANTSAINQIKVQISLDQFASGSTFHLYGIVS